jgi:hypothetical protein
VNKGRKNINTCKDLKNKLHFIPSKAITAMVIKENLFGSGTWVAHTIGKHATN